MKIDCISDLHGEYPILDGGNLLIIAGDWTGSDRSIQYGDFLEWVNRMYFYYDEIVMIAGNHEGLVEKGLVRDFGSAKYLQDSGCEYAGYKIWGSPWTPEFFQWYFMKPRGEELAKVWAKIPEDTDILVTHGPPKGILDYVKRGSRAGRFCGCEDLHARLKDLKKLKLHVFGHIHYSYGQMKSPDFPGIKFVNACLMNEDYDMVNKPITVNL